MTTTINVAITRGTTDAISFTAARYDGSIIDLNTAAEIWLTVKRSPSDADADAIFQKKKTTAGDFVLHSDPTTGLGDALLVPADTTGLTNTRTNLVYDIKVKESDGSIHAAQCGTLIVLPDVTTTTT